MRRIDCTEFRVGLQEMARGGPAIPHVTECAWCQAELAGQRRLQAALDGLAAEAADSGVPQRVEQAVMARLEAVGKRRNWRFGFGVAGTLAAGLAFAWWMAPGRPETKLQARAYVAPPVEAEAPVRPEATITRVYRKRRRLRTAAAPEPPFIAIPYTPPIAPFERADVMRVEMPVAALIAAGLPMEMADPGARARADLLVGQDGRARAIRLIAVSIPN